MSNDPDLLRHLPDVCWNCDGDGGWLTNPYDDDSSVWVDCRVCLGTGEAAPR